MEATQKPAPRMNPPLSLIICTLTLSSCAHNENSPQIITQTTAIERLTDESSESTAAIFTPTMAGYMAALGQYMDDVYRFWDSNSMHQVAIQRLDLMIETHDKCLEIHKDHMLIYEEPELRQQTKTFQDYLIKSKALTIQLKEAVISRDDEQVKEAFKQLDMNRRDAHSAFG